MAPLLTFYGDDFTGSSAVLEILAEAGLATIMCLDAPTPGLLAKVGPVQAIGIAGIARSRSPEWMSAELPRLLRSLADLGAPVLHYKTCSTFDSAPRLGSIGRATEIGLAVTGAAAAPLIVGAPAIGRWQIFGTLFAAMDGTAYRLDRHPVMSCHPATPMHEADLCRHLDGQTDLRKAVVDWRTLRAGRGGRAFAEARANGARIIAIDAFDEATLAAAGQVIHDLAAEAPVFVVGSQGVEYALVAHLAASNLLGAPPPRAMLTPAEPLLVVSGSCSEVTARQIAAAGADGFLVLPLDAARAVSEAGFADDVTSVAEAACVALSAGRNVLVCTAQGPDDPAIARLDAALASCGADPSVVHARIGAGLGSLVRQARLRTGLARAVLMGGDTSGHAMLAIGAEALEYVASVASGVPLLRVRATDPSVDGMEVALKGGQMGDLAMLIRAARGRA